jgi:hypothetical protein
MDSGCTAQSVLDLLLRIGGNKVKLLGFATATLMCFAVPQTHAKDVVVTAEMLALMCAGNVPDLIDKKDKDQQKHVVYCNGYFTGMGDGIGLFRKHGKTLGADGFCPPPMSVKEYSVVFFDYMATQSKERREQLKELPAGDVIAMAFKDKWPCQ